MVCQCPGPGANAFVAGLFNECIYNTKEMVSFIFGWASIASWAFAMLPQIRINLLLRRSEALSNAFLVLWVMGDLFNAISVFVLNQLLTQKILGCIWMVCDTTLIITHLYYSHTRKKYTSLSVKFRPTEIVAYIMCLVILLVNLIWAGVYGESLINSGTANLDSCPQDADLPTNSAQYIIGSIMAYITIPCYVFSRPGQIHKNRVRKTVDGLSMGMFIATWSGNFTQMISMFSYSQERNYMINKIPYIFAAFFPWFFDTVILIQVCIYRSKPLLRRGIMFQQIGAEEQPKVRDKYDKAVARSEETNNQLSGGRGFAPAQASTDMM